mgnify:FL=1
MRNGVVYSIKRRRLPRVLPHIVLHMIGITTMRAISFHIVRHEMIALGDIKPLTESTPS